MGRCKALIGIRLRARSDAVVGAVARNHMLAAGRPNSFLTAGNEN
jgi:hypothetical protein